MADNNGTGTGTVLLAFLVGAIAGAAVALLYAPVSGRETREYLGDKARAGVRKETEIYEEATGEQA